jgi:Domain of unknown function (DUF1840)
MLVTFKSKATESITMFGDVAAPLLKMMGASGKVPGALGAEDVAGALQQLETSVERLKAQTHAQPAAPAAMNEDWGGEDEGGKKDDDKDREQPVAIATRAVPLISLLKRAAAAKAEVIWE